MAEDDGTRARGTELGDELEELRERLQAPIKSSVDVAERRAELACFDAALEAARAAALQRGRRLRVRLVLAGIGALALVGGFTSIASARHLSVRSGSCRVLPACAEQGRCVPAFSTLIGSTTPLDEDGCVARSDRHCEHACTLTGRCRREGDVCVAVDDAHCERSARCPMEGACSKEGARCAPATDIHCQDSLDCMLDSRCSRVTEEGASRCVVSLP